MTTVVATRSALYADTYCSSDIPFGVTKLYKVTPKDEEEVLCGMAGYLEEGMFLIKLLSDHGLKNLWKLHYRHEGESQLPQMITDPDWNTELLIVTRDRQILTINNSLLPIEIHESQYAIGSGSTWALAAMDHGKSAKDAIEYATTRDPYSKAPIQTLTFRSK